MTPSQQLFEALKLGDESKAFALLDADPALIHGGGAAGMPPIFVAIYNGHRELAGRLIERGAKLDVFAAAALNKTDEVRLLLQATPSPINAHSSDGWTPLHLASFFGNFEVVELLLSSGADVKARSANTMHNTPLHAAAAGKHLKICALLLSHGAEVNSRQQIQYTPLHSAAANGDEELVRLFLAHQADPTALSEKGETPSEVARGRGHMNIVTLLERTSQ